jgi:DNA-binding response OmpR family regulator
VSHPAGSWGEKALPVRATQTLRRRVRWRTVVGGKSGCVVGPDRSGGHPATPQRVVGTVLVIGGGGHRQAALESAGHRVHRHGWHDPDRFRRSADLVLLDPGEGDTATPSTIGAVRRRHTGPILVTLEGSTVADRVRLLRAGADDCVESVADGELRARVAALLRRSTAPTAPTGISIDTASRTAQAGGRALDLTRREFDLLAQLAAAPRRVFTRQELLEQAWPPGSRPSQASLTEHIHRLRRKIAATGVTSEVLETVHGVGYRLVPEAHVPPALSGVERRRGERRRGERRRRDRPDEVVVLPDLAESPPDHGGR